LYEPHAALINICAMLRDILRTRNARRLTLSGAAPTLRWILVTTSLEI